MSSPLNKLSGTKKIEMFMAMVYSFCIVTSHLFRYKMEKSWKILQFGDISTGDHSAVGAALLLMRLPSLLIKPIASCRSLTRFVKIITFALDSCIFGGSFRKSMLYPWLIQLLVTCTSSPYLSQHIRSITGPTNDHTKTSPIVDIFYSIKSENVFVHL